MFGIGQNFVLFALVFLTLCRSFPPTLADAQRGQKGRREKLLSVFQIIQFPNDACEGGSNKNGTCYTEAECSSRGGVNGGSCADGFGVCCLQTLNCGDSSNENNTYFESSSTSESGGCSVSICPCNDNICQLRLDFTVFSITGPSTATSTAEANAAGYLVNGVISPSDGGLPVFTSGQCLTDTFSVTNPGGVSPPVICGANTGEHMYVDASPNCNTLAFQLGNTGNGASIVNRQWSIRVLQYSCDYSNLAPQGCTQYFFGANRATGRVQSFNYQGGSGQHLANQDQAICIRRETQYCRICYYARTPTDFAVSGAELAAGAPLSGIASYNEAAVCCGYSQADDNPVGFDCVMIPGAAKKTTATAMLPSRFCGRSSGLVTLSGNTATAEATVCTTQTPFVLHFRSDAYEVTNEASAPNPGFVLTYAMDSICDLPVNEGR